MGDFDHGEGAEAAEANIPRRFPMDHDEGTGPGSRVETQDTKVTVIEGEVHVTASSNGRALTRENTTVSSTTEKVTFYRVDTPPIFVGFQQNWVDGEEPETGMVFTLTAGAGYGSRYMILTVTVPGRRTVYEYVDITEVLRDRVATIITELGEGTS